MISELTKAFPAPSVVAFLSERDDLWTSSVVLHELEFGLQLLPRGRRRDDLKAVLSGFVSAYENRILPLERREAEWAARLRAHAHLTGHTLHLGDALIAGTAKVHDLSVATRNTADFDGLDVPLMNPWDSS